jgi:site-specific recombinase XerD
MAEGYQDALKAKTTLKLRDLLRELPPFLGEYFRSISDQTSARTRVGYAYDLKIFFNFLFEECEYFNDKTIRACAAEDLAHVTSEQLEEFMEYLSYYIRADEENDVAMQNDVQGKSRKLAAIRTMFRYFYSKKKIPANPAELVGFPKLNEKAITTLEVDEIAKLLDEVDSGEHLTERQKKYHEMTKIRDAAIITLMLGTGMRVSECVGIDVDHVDFETNGVIVTRKGGDEMVLYFGTEVEKALKQYLFEREAIATLPGHEKALFLSLQNRRITDRAVQNLVKKYAKLVTNLKKISPHKLRSTFGTQLYRETGDIYLVANVLGHADVNTTRKHYAKMDDEHRRRAANAVKLRE